MPNYLNALANTQETIRGGIRNDRLMSNRLAAFRAEQEALRKQNALARAAGGQYAEGNLEGARDVLARGGDLKNALALEGQITGQKKQLNEQQQAALGELGTFATNLFSLPKEQWESVYQAALPQIVQTMEDAGLPHDPNDTAFDPNEWRALAAQYGKVPGGNVRASLNPVYGTDAEGNTVLLQPTESGKAVRTQIPEGVTVSEPVRPLDTGTAFELRGTRTGRPRGRVEKDVAGEAEAKARGQLEGKGEIPQREQKATGQKRLSTALQALTQNYLKLNELGEVVNPDRGGLENMTARLAASSVGQLIGGTLGTEAQSLRESIKSIRPLIVQHIRAASGMSARGMDSNQELKFYLQAATDPEKDIFSNLVAIQVLDDTFGLGNVLEQTVPKDILERVKNRAKLDREERPIKVTPEQRQEGGSEGAFVQTEDGVYVEQ